ncbi:MAG: hypothetical protein R3F13_02470 [Prosthecobacter sp.]
MKRFFINILYMNPQNSSDLVVVLALGVLLAMWLFMIADVVKQDESIIWKIGWTLICSLPLLGGCLYSVRELMRADWASAFSIRRHDATSKKP